MLEDLKKQSVLMTIFLTLGSIALGIYVFQIFWGILGFFSDVLIILFSAWILSFILGPAVERLQKLFKVPRVAAAIFVYVVFFAAFASIISAFIPTVTSQYFA